MLTRLRCHRILYTPECLRTAEVVGLTGLDYNIHFEIGMVGNSRQTRGFLLLGAKMKRLEPILMRIKPRRFADWVGVVTCAWECFASRSEQA